MQYVVYWGPQSPDFWGPKPPSIGPEYCSIAGTSPARRHFVSSGVLPLLRVSPNDWCFCWTFRELLKKISTKLTIESALSFWQGFLLLLLFVLLHWLRRLFSIKVRGDRRHHSLFSELCKLHAPTNQYNLLSILFSMQSTKTPVAL